LILPTERLALITSLPESTVEEGKSGVDQLYTKVLQQAFHGVHADNSQRYLRFQTVVGTVLLIFNPLSIKGLSELLGCNVHTSAAPFDPSILSSLSQRVQKTPSHIFHKSFPDFLMDPDRCQDKQILCGACRSSYRNSAGMPQAYGEKVEEEYLQPG
jgi:hypothetical protein